MRSKFNLLFILLFVTCLSAPIPPSASAEGLKQVLILPFTINAEKDLAYLNRGMVSMLSSRLFHQGRLTTITGEKSAATLEAAIKLGADSGADYVTYGSITVFGKSVSTDLKLVDVENETTAINFSRSGNKKGDVVSHIDQFAAQANAMLMRSPAPPAAAAAQPVPQAAQPAIVAPVPVVVATPAPTAAAPAAISEQPKNKIWRSNRLQGEISSMAVGDVDGDGRIEIVMVVGLDVSIHRYEKGKLKTVGEIKGKAYEKLLGIDVADINANGKAEIYITRLNKQRRLVSSVLEWSGKGFSPILEKAGWYFRVIDVPGRGNVLMGQKRPPVSSSGGGDFEMPGANQLFLPGVFELTWQGEQLIAGERQPLPRGMNIYGFNYGNVIKPDQPMIVAMNEERRLRILNAAGKKQWTGAGRFGGSPVYIEYPAADDQNKTERLYLLQRVLVADLDNDGTPEVVVTKNKDVSRDLFTRFRSYTSGQVICLSWETVTMKTRWETEAISGHVADIALADIDRDGRIDLIYTVVSGEEGMFKKAVSYVVIQWGVSGQ